MATIYEFPGRSARNVADIERVIREFLESRGRGAIDPDVVIENTRPLVELLQVDLSFTITVADASQQDANQRELERFSMTIKELFNRILLERLEREVKNPAALR